MAYSDGEKRQLFKDIFDPARIVLVCKQHMYIGTGAPTAGCKDCWLVYFQMVLGKTPPHLREQRLDELEALVHHMVESIERGELPVTLYAHPEVKVEKEQD